LTGFFLKIEAPEVVNQTSGASIFPRSGNYFSQKGNFFLFGTGLAIQIVLHTIEMV
jgi:hypothetical protein